MHYRLHIALVFLAPVALVGGLYAFGLTLPLPSIGRDYVVRIRLPDAGAPAALPAIAGPADRSRPLVVLDPGHGGHDPGAAGAGFREKTLTLGLARTLRDELVRGGGIRVALTRDDDRYLMLEERSEIARALGADLFLSVHADSAGEQDEVSGASVYTLSGGASSQAAARFAERENNADVINGVPLTASSSAVSAILVELSQRRAQEQAAEFAALVVREGQSVLAFHPQPRRSAALVVLRAPDVPSALFEAGFITNPADAERLASPDGQRRFAQAMARAIRIYFARREGP
ncbi:MAG: N-acetylmuramoyl-L-alanine amidase [Sphingomonadales bacterium 12-68-11]|nr:MAG: N-acetylmuramoyl-L-alanine amidase [Sphingomonadales bacterium 12-68-11]